MTPGLVSLRRLCGLLAVVSGVAACPAPRHDHPVTKSAPILAPLPPPTPLDTERFGAITVCVRCHAADERAMRGASGQDISPVTDFASSMMGLSTRDPYYLAAVRRELAAHPALASSIEPLCIRCHAPVGFAEDRHLGIDDLVRGTTPRAVLGRDGVGCLGCHAMLPDGLGTAATFVNNTELRQDRAVYGVLPAPLGDAMVQMIRSRPLPSTHVSESRLCAPCHTVLVHPVSPVTGQLDPEREVAEQTTYLEWKNSAFQDESAPLGQTPMTCQSCHMPATEDELDPSSPPIATPISARPVNAPTREHYRRHTLRGGNAYLLGALARNTPWLQSAASADQLADAAARTERFLTRSAELAIVPDPGGAQVRITVTNRTGHKLPTGYPSRRMWLHVTVRDAHGAIVLESGAHRDGRIQEDTGRPRHVDVIRSSRDVAIWEAVPVATTGIRTHLLLDTVGFAKDDRVLPAGWRDDHADISKMPPIGIEGDHDFLPGSDTVAVAIPRDAAEVSAELLYQAIPPETIGSYRATDSPEAARFLAIASHPPLPQVLARAAHRLARASAPSASPSR